MWKDWIMLNVRDLIRLGEPDQTARRSQTYWTTSPGW